MFHRISVGIQQRGVPVAQGFVALVAEVREANVAACDIQTAIATGQDELRRFSVRLASPGCRFPAFAGISR